MNLFISNSKRFVSVFLVISVTGMVGGIVATEALVRISVIPNHNDYKYAKIFKAAKTGNAIFGDSHAAYGLTNIEGFVNIAYGGDNFEAISNKIRLYFKDRKPEKIILQAGVHHFSRDFLSWRQDDTERFEKFLEGYPPYYPRMFLGVHRKELFKYWMLFFQGRPFVPQQTFMPDGSRLSNVDYTTLPKRVRNTAYRRTVKILEPVNGFERSPVAAEYRDIIDFLQTRGGEVCLITLPAISPLQKAMGNRSSYARAQKFFDRLAAKKGIRYLNFLMMELPDTYFSDPHHLNAQGARTFSRHVANECFS